MTIKVDENKLIIDGKSFSIEKKLVIKLDRICRGVTQKNPKEDAFLINEGKEGKGKSNSSVVEAAYIKAKTGRDVHIFFRLDDIIKFSQATKEKIIIWDEPSLDSLSADQVRRINKDLTRLFMTIRKKRHVFIINYVKFWKFPEYIVVDRANGLIHHLEKKIGRFFYIREKKLEALWNEKKKSNKRAYKKYMSFGGRMPDIMEECFDKLDFYVCDIKNAKYDDYENEKDKAILSIGNEEKKSFKETEAERKLKELRLKVSSLWKNVGIEQNELAKQLGVNASRIREWSKLTI